MIMELEENSYFKSVVKDAVSDLKNNGVAFVFFQEQVDAVKSIINKNDLEVQFDGTFFRLQSSGGKIKKAENRGRRKCK